jgi:peptidoglycan-N-acetylglucosamine deacetylase
MTKYHFKILFIAAIVLANLASGCATTETARPGKFSWPGGKKACVTLTFDDSIPSQYETAEPLMQKYGLKGTFFMMGSWWFIPPNLDNWKKVHEDGNEIALHSFGHPCDSTLTDAAYNKSPAQGYTLQKIEDELKQQKILAKQNGFGPGDYTYAYPCGIKWVGEKKESYVPVVKKLFLAGRDLVYTPEQAVVDPVTVDLSEVPSYGTDGKKVEDLTAIIEDAKQKGGWVVFYIHGVGSGWVVTDTKVYEGLLQYLDRNKKDLWIATFGEAAGHIKKSR